MEDKNWDPDDVIDVLMQPMGVVRVHEQYTHDAPMVMSKEQWIGVNTKLITQIGVEAWLRRFLTILESGDTPYASQSKKTDEELEVIGAINKSVSVFGAWIGQQIAVAVASKPKRDRDSAWIDLKEKAFAFAEDAAKTEGDRASVALSALLMIFLNADQSRLLMTEDWPRKLRIPPGAALIVEAAAKDNISADELLSNLRGSVKRPRR